MKNPKDVLKLPGMYLYYGFLLAGIPVLLFLSRGDIVISLNQQHHPLADVFFRFWTWLGDGLVFVPVMLFFLFRSWFFLLLTTLSVVFQTVLVQGMKRVAFSDVVRPRLFFETFDQFHIPPDVVIHGHHAFPSGHTATAFTLALVFSVFLKNRSISIFLFLAALLVGLSRIYLLQHFFIDVYFGSLAGVMVTLLSLALLHRYRLEGKPPWNSSLRERLIR